MAYKEKSDDKHTDKREVNRQLVERFPFLRVGDTDQSDENEYQRTWLDYMPKGWKKAFGIQFCKELSEAIKKYDPSALETYQVLEVKEKYGELRWYDTCAGKEKEDVITKYEHISRHTCIFCGKINVPIFDDGWVCPYCIDCFKDFRSQYLERQVSGEEIVKYMVDDSALTRNIVLKESGGGEGYRIRTIDCSDTLRALGVDPDSLPTEDMPDEHR